VCDWHVEAPAVGDATWRVLQLDAGLFQAAGVPEGARAQVMQHLGANFGSQRRPP
jgi:hypothetical protein